MTEVRRLLHLHDVNDINIWSRYIRSAANIWADILSRELDRDNRQLSPRIFGYLQSEWGPHSIDHFASMENAQLPRFNAKWRDPKCEDVDCLHMLDAAWQREANYCNLPWDPQLCAKLHKSGAAATVITYLLAPQTMVSTATKHGHRDHPLPRLTRHVLPRTAQLARGGWTTMMQPRGFSTATPAWLHTCRGAIGRTQRTPSPTIADLRSITCRPPIHPRPARYKLR
jgi:hypothetical protein